MIEEAVDAIEEKRAADAAKRRARADADILRKIMMTRDGRDWLFRKLEACHIFGNAFVPGSSDTTAFRLGEQNVGKMLMSEAMDASADLYLRMINEQREEEKRLAKVRRENAKAQAPEMETAAHMVDLPAPEGWTG